METKNVSEITIKIKTKDGEKVEIKNPAGLVLSFVSEEITKIAKEELKGKLGGVHLSGKKMDIIFCFHTLIINMTKIFGEKFVLEVFEKVFTKKFDEMLKHVDFIKRAYKNRNGELLN